MPFRESKPLCEICSAKDAKPCDSCGKLVCGDHKSLPKCLHCFRDSDGCQLCVDRCQVCKGARKCDAQWCNKVAVVQCIGRDAILCRYHAPLGSPPRCKRCTQGQRRCDFQPCAACSNATEKCFVCENTVCDVHGRKVYCRHCSSSLGACHVCASDLCKSCGKLARCASCNELRIGTCVSCDAGWCGVHAPSQGEQCPSCVHGVAPLAKVDKTTREMTALKGVVLGTAILPWMLVALLDFGMGGWAIAGGATVFAIAWFQSDAN